VTYKNIQYSINKNDQLHKVLIKHNNVTLFSPPFNTTSITTWASVPPASIRVGAYLRPSIC